MLLRISTLAICILFGASAHVRAHQVLWAFGKVADSASIEVRDAEIAIRGDWLQGCL